jgi:very-short-patch-repair endonuclease
MPALNQVVPRQFTDSQLRNARRLRREMTNAETMLWRSLRDRGLGMKFRRKVPVGPYIADFLCKEAMLIVELDGPPHDDPDQRQHDARRDAWLRAQGWRVLRFSNDLVIGGGNIILDKIRAEIALRLQPSSDPR